MKYYYKFYHESSSLLLKFSQLFESSPQLSALNIFFSVLPASI